MNITAQFLGKCSNEAMVSQIFYGTIILFGAVASAVAGVNEPTPELHRLGQQLYQENCAICHGPNGGGDGILSTEFSPSPRDFTQGVFRFSSTPNGTPPARADIERVIMRGIEGSYGRTMPAFDTLSPSEVQALAEVVRQFAAVDAYGEPVQVKRHATPNPERGAELYASMGCSSCHGPSGQGNGPAADHLEDESGAKIRPADLTAGKFKGGNDLHDVWLRIYNGVPGTPMPSFGRNADVNDIWEIVLFISQMKE